MHHQSSVSTSPVLAEQAGAPGAVATTEGEVRKVDKDAEKLTIKHGSIANLDMPGMTMVFRVSDPAMLDSVKPGDKVRFIVDRIGGLFTVTKIEPVQ
ncbi:copper-binding protein [Rhodoferax sediminis]|uniref:Copper-binding protein n=2 Tax=Rhodoferax sediminis TaxID=2509614 RepID=A0A515DGS4_9BURK|nr:copper-binding protein [Rhodoferax sediminis]QDL39626.1 copper-binding protein [Rhodoferax sediminis]